MGGNLRTDFVKEDVEVMRRAIREFKPDLCFSELRYQAIVAARLEAVPLAGTHSFPVRAHQASSLKLSAKVREWL